MAPHDTTQAHGQITTRKQASKHRVKIPGPKLGDEPVRKISRSMVLPAAPTAMQGQWLALSNLDRVVNPTFSSVIIFYNHALQKHTFREISQSLRLSLSKVLVDFYPLAGKLAMRDNGLVDIFCSDEGAVFIEASVEVELSRFGGPQPMPALSGLELARLGPGPAYVPDQISSIPSCVIQLTKFRCGSIAVAVNWHHTIADGSAGCLFLRSWSEVALGKLISVPPIHNRDLLKPRDPLDPSLVNNYSADSIPDTIVRQLKCSSEPAMHNSFSIAKAAVQGLKERVSMEDSEGRQFTSAEAVSAQLWKQFTKARLENPNTNSSSSAGQENVKTRFYMFVDGRKRLNLTAGYFGNVVCSACAESDEKDIIEKPLSYAADLIRRATRNITGDYFRSLIDWVEAQGLGTRTAKSSHMNSIGHDVAATFWTFFPLYDLDFGWGKPDLAARNSPPRPYIDGIAMMPGADGPGNMVALLTLHADRMARLTKQRSFNTMVCS